MIDRSQLTESEIRELKMIVLEKKKEMLEKEIETIKSETTDNNRVKKIADYFKN